MSKRKVSLCAVERKKLFLIFLVVLLILMISIPFVDRAVAMYEENTRIVSVNGESVLLSEFKRVLLQNSASVYSYFKEKHGVDDHSEFWTTDYHGEIPIDVARRKALDQLIRIKVEQALAKKMGIIKDIEYTAFLKNLKEENKARKEAVKANKIIYGPQQFGEKEYFNYIHSNMLIRLKEKLGEPGQVLYAQEDKLKEYYEANKEESYRKPGNLKVQKVSVAYVAEESKQIAYQKTKEIKARLEDGESIDSISTAYASDRSVAFNFENVNYDRRSMSYEIEANPSLHKVLQSIREEETSSLIDGNRIYHVIKCIQRETDGYSSYEEISASVRSAYIDEKYEEMVGRLVQSAKIEINERMYKNTWVR